jgi:tellurite resistance protein TehA-like permease
MGLFARHLRELGERVRDDHGGSFLALARSGDGSAAALAAAASALHAVALGLWALAMAWLPVLVAGEALAPRRGFDARRWSTVFPVGMYAAMSHAVGVSAFARAWTWVAVAVWALVALASADRARTRGWRTARAADRMAP